VGLARQPETPEAKLRRLSASPTESEVAGNRNILYENSHKEKEFHLTTSSYEAFI